jgi:hypothetical protein
LPVASAKANTGRIINGTQRLDRKSYLCIPMLKANCFVAGIDLNQSGNAKARRLDSN